MVAQTEVGTAFVRITKRFGTLTREQLLEQITRMNRSVSVSWLDRFDQPALLQYLERLLRQDEPRSSESVWVRDPRNPAITQAVPSLY
ncbi:MAG: hypothetical protein ACFHWZ_14565 [Phycisphaerales bacterium]|nr:hypothetical protein [bacterium]